ncbi:MAG: O-antigen ligase family protein [Trueperaceae bacterium]|nr:O-antigen ligase family protein [Trueperaceae bacterium]
MHPSREAAPRPAPLRRIALAALAAWVALSVSSLVVDDGRAVAVTGAVLAVGVAVVAAARAAAFRRVAGFAVVAYAVVLAVATVVAGATSTDAGDGARIALFTGNPNDLGAALVVACAAWAALAAKRRYVAWAWPLVALAVLNTGSRTSGGALLAAGAVWLALALLERRPRLLLAPVAMVAVVAIAAVAWQRGVVEISPNLLAAPSDLTYRAWRTDLAERVEVVPDAVDGPFPGTRGQRLVAQALPDSRTLVLQSTGGSEPGVPYVASIFVRADVPQELVLSSHLAQTTCAVGPEWTRCITPAAPGDGYTQAQFYLRTPDRGGAVDLYVFGAQYEVGTEASPFLDVRPAWLPQEMVRRYDLRRISLLPESRRVVWAAAIDLARDHPWFGVGLTAAPDAFRERTDEHFPGGVTYAHHLWLQLWAVFGVVGVAGAALVAVATLSTLHRPGWARLAPLLVALTLLHTWDLTLFEPEVALPALLAVAAWVGVPAASAAGAPITR